MYALNNKPIIEIWTHGNPSGEWACTIKQANKKRTLAGKDPAGGGRPAIKAIVEGLKSLQQPSIVAVYATFDYVLDGANKYLESWKKKGFPIKNADLWIEFYNLKSKHEIQVGKKFDFPTKMLADSLKDK